MAASLALTISCVNTDTHRVALDCPIASGAKLGGLGNLGEALSRAAAGDPAASMSPAHADEILRAALPADAQEAQRRLCEVKRVARRILAGRILQVQQRRDEQGPGR
jgi:hypothetical protein